MFSLSIYMNSVNILYKKCILKTNLSKNHFITGIDNVKSWVTEIDIIYIFSFQNYFHYKKKLFGILFNLNSN